MDVPSFYYPDSMKKLSQYCENNVSAVYSQEYITILHGLEVIDRFHIGEYEPEKVRRIFKEVEKITDKRYLFKSLLRKRLRQVRHQPIY